MPTPIIRYALDPTGENPNNLVIGEVHELSDHAVRALAPHYGPFFKESVVLYDNVTNRQLDKDVDYTTHGLLQDPTLDFGREISQLILIKNRQVSKFVSVTYQNLGGNYQNSSAAVADALETLKLDARPVDWATGIFDKPYQYNPSTHVHLLDDVVGFAPLVVALERVAQAITLSNVPAFETLIDWVKNFEKTWVSEQEIRNMNPVEKVVSLERLLFAAKNLNFNAITFRPTNRLMNLGSGLKFTISSTNYDKAEPMFWTVEHSLLGDGTTDDMFGSLNGVVYPINQEGSFFVHTRKGAAKSGRYRFDVKLRRNSINGPVLAESGDILVEYRDPLSNTDLAMQNGLWEHVCCLQEPGLIPTAEGMFLIRESFNYQTL